MAEKHFMAFNVDAMKGTTGSDFTLELVGANFRIGSRNLGDNTFRVRVEPLNDVKFAFPSGWANPGYGKRTHRYSIVVKGSDKKAAAILDAVRVCLGVSTATVSTVPSGTTIKPAQAIPEYK
jgi:hypothetical protein